MNKKRLAFTAVTTLLMIFSYAEIVNFLPATLKGSVQDSRSGKPVAGAHVYVTKGEEEMFSSVKGEFAVKTWQSLPVTVVVEHKDYKTQTVRITNGTERLTVSLIPTN
ncbi:MAG: carboxypeptidase-like regulatory domain-containing protein [Chitinophagaceae bacterium]|nr:carboxypeptidase-like regulatory domain-containing protein [Chitinophagaceae bacterium]